MRRVRTTHNWYPRNSRTRTRPAHPTQPSLLEAQHLAARSRSLGSHKGSARPLRNVKSAAPSRQSKRRRADGRLVTWECIHITSPSRRPHEAHLACSTETHADHIPESSTLQLYRKSRRAMSRRVTRSRAKGTPAPPSVERAHVGSRVRFARINRECVGWTAPKVLAEPSTGWLCRRLLQYFLFGDGVESGEGRLMGYYTLNNQRAANKTCEAEGAARRGSATPRRGWVR